MTDNTTTETYAAIDLGSNSFHMIVANYSNDNLQIIDRIKEMNRLAAGLDHENRLSEAAMNTAISCLQRFGQRIREIPSLQVRAVGTNTLRKAKNSEAFLERANAALGHPIEIIAGREEARLIYQGVTNTIYNRDEQRLVVDIGGGSTELIIGRGPEPLLLESLYMGCVNLTRNYFSDGEISAKRMRHAILFARQELELIENIYRQSGWNTVVGSSGTILCINEILRAQGWSDNAISNTGLNRLKEELIRLGHSDALRFVELPESRRPVFAGGVAILCAVFEGLVIDQMQVSEGALREGLLHDLIGRRHDRDIRDRSIEAMMIRYGVDQPHARHTRETARILFQQVAEDWRLHADPDLKLLSWAALVHEIGISVAHAQHHKHAAYLVTHSDLAGFSCQEQQIMALLVRAHRRKFPMEELALIPALERNHIFLLCILLRLSVVLNRSRSISALPGIRLSAGELEGSLEFPGEWLRKHPLTQADLELEAEFLSAAGFRLTLS